jgi:threonine dehydratase
MTLFTRAELDAAVPLVRRLMPPTPQYAWPLLRARTGVEVVVKHENHTPTGAFKLRGGATYMQALADAGALPPGLVTATRGNHGQTFALVATRHGIPACIVVPEGNSREKNRAMEAFGGEIVVAGRDFDEARRAADEIEQERGWHRVPAFHRELVRGVATYALELFTAHPDLATVYVPVGMGSGICALITVRDLLGLDTEIVGVVAERAPAFARSFEARRPVATATAATFADGLACRDPQPEPLAIIVGGAARIVELAEDEIAEAMRMLYTDTHNVAEGAGAAGLAALVREHERLQGRKAAMILCGGNIDREKFVEVLSGRTPTP